MGCSFTNLHSTVRAASIHVPRRTRQKIQRMTQQRQQGPQRAFRAPRTARQVDHQRRPQRPADASAQRRKRRMLRPIRPNQLGQPRRQPLAYGQRRLRRHIPRRESRAPSRHNQRTCLSGQTQRRGYFLYFVRHRHRCTICAGIHQSLPHRRPGKIHLRPGKAAVTHSNDCRGPAFQRSFHPRRIPRPQAQPLGRCENRGSRPNWQTVQLVQLSGRTSVTNRSPDAFYRDPDRTQAASFNRAAAT